MTEVCCAHCVAVFTSLRLKNYQLPVLPISSPIYSPPTRRTYAGHDNRAPRVEYNKPLSAGEKVLQDGT